MARNNCMNYHTYALVNSNGTRDERSHKYWFHGAGNRVQFMCFQCDSKWEDYERFKAHCLRVHGYNYEWEAPDAYPWNFSNPNSAYQLELRAVKELIINAKERRRAQEDHVMMVNANVNAGAANQANNNNVAAAEDQVNNNNDMSTEKLASEATESDSSGEMSDVYANVTSSMIVAELEKRKRFPDQ